MKNLMFLFSLLFFSFSTIGQESEVVIKVKDTVAVGTPFKLEIELKNMKGMFKTPEFQGLRLVGGPNTSSSMTIVNGETNSRTTYTYFLMAEEVGNFTIILHDMETGEEILSFEEIQVTAKTNSKGDSQIIKYYETSRPDNNKIQSSKRKIRKI